jgi:hypothetical protein
MTLGNRIARLEARLVPDPDDPLGFKHLSEDEFNILLLDVYRLWLADPKMSAELSAQAFAELSATVVVIEEKIRRCAASRANPEYDEHHRWVRASWAECFSGQGEFVPPLTAENFNDWSDDAKKRGPEMRWRAEIRGRPDIAALIAEGEHEMTLKHRLVQLEKVREHQGSTLSELINAAGEGRAPRTPSDSALASGSSRRSGPLTLAELVAKSYESETPMHPAGPVAAAEGRAAVPTPATPGPRLPAAPTKPTNPAPRTLTASERIAADMAWIVARQSGWERSDNQDEKPGIAA